MSPFLLPFLLLLFVVVMACFTKYIGRVLSGVGGGGKPGYPKGNLSPPKPFQSKQKFLF